MKKFLGRTTAVPKPTEFFADGRRFLQYGVSPVKIATIRSTERKSPKGTKKNPIIKNGKEYVYTKEGKLVVLEHLDKETVKRNTVNFNIDDAETQIEKLESLDSKMSEPDEDCPELTEEQLAEIMRKARKKM